MHNPLCRKLRRGRTRTRDRVENEGEGPQTPPAEEETGPLSRDQVDDIVTQGLTVVIPTIIAQMRADEAQPKDNEVEAEQPVITQGPRDAATGRSYKAFMGCKPKELYGNEGTIRMLRWIDEMEAVIDISNCIEKDKVRFATHSFKGEALEWWNTIIQARGRQAANSMSWAELVKLLTEKYCPINKMEKLQTEFLSLSMVGKDVQGYTQKFNALARLLPYLGTPKIQKVNWYVWGLEPRVRSYVKAAQPATMKLAVELAAIVTDDRV